MKLAQTSIFNRSRVAVLLSNSNYNIPHLRDQTAIQQSYICNVDENKKIRVAIFEDNPAIMDAYRPIINGSSTFICTGCFTSCNNWKQDMQKSNPDVVLMDI